MGSTLLVCISDTELVKRFSHQLVFLAPEVQSVAFVGETDDDGLGGVGLCSGGESVDHVDLGNVEIGKVGG